MDHLFSKKVGIWGFGIVGQSAFRFALSRGCTDFIIIDKKLDTQQSIDPKDRSFVRFYIESPETKTEMLESCDLIVPSPGIDIREYSQYAQKFVSELDIFERYATTSSIAITGSVGKTTITTLLGSLLTKAGFENETAGNIGNGMLDLITHRQAPDYSVLEVSSFQLEQVNTFSPHIAIISNIYPNHLDRHGTLQEYIQAKARLLSFQKSSDFCILPWELKDVFANTHVSQAQKIWHFSHQISADFIKQYTSSEPLYTILDNAIVRVNNTRVTPVISLNQIPDVSLIANWIIIVATLETLGIQCSTLIHSALQLAIPHHRIEHIGTYNGVSFYNDSKSTIPASTVAAIEKLNAQQLILFIGGVSKGVDREPFVGALKGIVKTLYCFGTESKILANYARKQNIDTHNFETLEMALEHYFAHPDAQDCVLFSPAGASFDLFTNYQHRGEFFKTLVYKYAKCRIRG